jgi:2-oxoglutarate ferredoxin oxidoreductase subunit alpha
MFSRPVEGTEDWIREKFAGKAQIIEANLRAFRAGIAFGETTEVFSHSFVVRPATLEPGTYRNVTGNTALSIGLVAASVQSGLPLFLAGYPITPASDILQELARHKAFGVKTMQAEDEIASAGAALGASFAGYLGATVTSGPGLDLKAEAIGLGVSVELPLLVIDIQRAGPSTGMPTKTEQADLLHAMFGRHGEAPLPIVAASTPADCFDIVLEATRLAP